MTTEQVAAPAVEKAPEAPKIDTAQIAADVAKINHADVMKMAESRAAEIASEKLKVIGRAIAGEPEEPKVNPLLEAMVKDPAKVLVNLKEITKKELRDEATALDAVRNVQRSVGSEFIAEYPEINTKKKLAVVEKFADEHQAAGMSYEEALKKGFEDAVKEFNLTSVTEAQKAGTYRNVGLPTGGGMRAGVPAFNETKSQTDFIAAMRDRVNSTRNKKS